ncbi:hypothetical protein, partial [uncultured Nocardioides sp.]|uniref:hypothetical protein n=1 Tax=uncultured Nocardioides sp. TaxID=198441 RepID=UPI00262994C4
FVGCVDFTVAMAVGVTVFAMPVEGSLLALALVVAAVATGRGWRSAWWSRRAEVLEGLVGALALASLVPATGLFRLLWENVPDV